MVGLDNQKFHDHLTINNFKLYCHPVTRILLLNDPHYRSLEEHIVGLEPQDSHIISVPIRRKNVNPDVNEEGTSESFEVPEKTLTVTLISAGHCPGSVMFFFEGNEGNILYTGDFRLSKKDFRKLTPLHTGMGRVKQLETVYYDSTFCTQECRWIPGRTETMEKLNEEVLDWLKWFSLEYGQQTKPTGKSGFWVRRMLLFAASNYGHECLLVSLSKHFGVKVHVTKEKYKIYSQIRELRNHVTCDPYESPLHACAYWEFDKNEAVKRKGCRGRGTRRSEIPSCPETPTWDPDVLVIKPSMMWFAMLPTYEQKKICIKDKDSGILRVLYSCHSSLTEVRDFLKYLNPNRAFPNVAPNRSSLGRVAEIMSDIVKTREEICEDLLIFFEDNRNAVEGGVPTKKFKTYKEWLEERLIEVRRKEWEAERIKLEEEWRKKKEEESSALSSPVKNEIKRLWAEFSPNKILAEFEANSVATKTSKSQEKKIEELDKENGEERSSTTKKLVNFEKSQNAIKPLSLGPEIVEMKKRIPVLDKLMGVSDIFEETEKLMNLENSQKVDNFKVVNDSSSKLEKEERIPVLDKLMGIGSDISGGKGNSPDLKILEKVDNSITSAMNQSELEKEERIPVLDRLMGIMPEYSQKNFRSYLICLDQQESPSTSTEREQFLESNGNRRIKQLDKVKLRADSPRKGGNSEKGQGSEEEEECNSRICQTSLNFKDEEGSKKNSSNLWGSNKHFEDHKVSGFGKSGRILELDKLFERRGDFSERNEQSEGFQTSKNQKVTDRTTTRESLCWTDFEKGTTENLAIEIPELSCGSDEDLFDETSEIDPSVEMDCEAFKWVCNEESIKKSSKLKYSSRRSNLRKDLISTDEPQEDRKLSKSVEKSLKLSDEPIIRTQISENIMAAKKDLDKQRGDDVKVVFERKGPPTPELITLKDSLSPAVKISNVEKGGKAYTENIGVTRDEGTSWGGAKRKQKSQENVERYEYLKVKDGGIVSNSSDDDDDDIKDRFIFKSKITKLDVR